DNNKATEQLDGLLLKRIADKKVLTILNKSDLPIQFDAGKLPEMLAETVQISAMYETGIERLLKRIPQICGVADFDLKAAVCFTGRQESLLKQLYNAKSKEQASSIITELLNGPLSV
ncbi:MAG: P-loop NTPase family protein, partial [Planctomycetota bacterium]